VKKLVHVRQDQNHMATTFSFVVSCEDDAAPAASRALAEAHAYVSRLEGELTEFRESSPIHALNRAAPGVRVKLSRAGIELLARSERWRQATRGAFDCAAKSAAKPAEGASVAWDETACEAWRLGPEVHVGFGAIGKGYALDGVRLILEHACFRDFLLTAGGSSVVLSGFAGPGDPWSFGWSWAKDSDGDSVGIPLSHDSGAAMAIGVSGTHEKGNHLVDSRPLPERDAHDESPLSALVGSQSAADADALSTALFVAGFDRTMADLKDLPLAPALACVDPDRAPRWNGIFQNFWGAPARGLALFALSAGLAASAPLDAISPQARADDAPAALETSAPYPAPLETSAAGSLFDTPASPVPLEASASPVPGAPEASVTAASGSADEGAVDLGGMSANTFTPYLTERNGFWALLPIFALAAVLLHLKKNRRPAVTPNPSKPTSLMIATALAWCSLEQAHAVDLVPLGTALQTVLGTKSAFKKPLGETTVFYSKDKAGRADRVAFIEKNIWQKSCTHTWIVGIGRDGRVTQVVAQEQQCPHAKPSAADSFLDQYKGKGPADVAKLKGDVSTIAKATGSCELATDAVSQAITTYQKIKGKM
jgi:thiamine biosynthesis lipoprotein